MLDQGKRSRLKAIAERLKQNYGAQRVLLFGSEARGESTENSDIDLLVISPTKDKFYKRIGLVHQAIRELSYGLPLSPIVLTPEEVRTRLARGDQFVQEIMETGIEP